MATDLRIDVDDDVSVSALHEGPTGAPVLVLAHGAGGTMRNPLLDGFAAGLVAGGVGCVRFNFAYAEAGRRGPDREPLLRHVWAAAFERARDLGAPVWWGESRSAAGSPR